MVALCNFSRSAETFPVLGIFLKPMTAEFGWSRSVFSGALTIGSILGGLLAVGTGPFIDRYGPRWVLVGAFFILGGTLVLLSQIDHLWQFYTLEILGRMVTMGIIALSTSVIIPKWFAAKRGRAVAVGGLGIRVGNTITPLYVQLLVNVGSWRLAAAATGLVMWTLSLLPAALFLRRRPEDMGLLPDGRPPRDPSQNPASAAGGETAQAPREELSLPLRQVARLSSFYLLVAAFATASFISTGLNLHVVPFLTDRQLSPETAVAVVAVWSASGGLGSLFFGFLAERYSLRMIISTTFTLLAGSYILLLSVHSPALGLFWDFYQGVLHGGMTTLQILIFADYYGRDSLGSIRGAIQPVQLGANAMGPLTAALVYDSTGSYLAIFTIFAFLALFSGLCIFLTRRPVLNVSPQAL